MAIPDELLYEYAVVRYVPRVDRGEFVNIGLIMMCKRRRWLRGEIRLNAERISAFAPGVDIESVRVHAALFTRGDVPSPDIPVEERYRWLTAVKSAVLQVSPSHPGLLVAEEDSACRAPAELLDKEFERLMKDLVM